MRKVDSTDNQDGPLRFKHSDRKKEIESKMVRGANSSVVTLIMLAFASGLLLVGFLVCVATWEDNTMAFQSPYVMDVPTRSIVR